MAKVSALAYHQSMKVGCWRESEFAVQSSYIDGGGRPMSMQIPDYSVFAQMPVSARRQSLEMIRRFAGQHSASLFLQVYQFDPDAELREMARQELAKQGITPPTDPTPMTVSGNGGNGGNGSGASFSMSSTHVETNGDAYSLKGLFQTEAPFTADAGIDGGNGRPVQRGPQLANIFTLYRRNSKYLTGERAHLQHNPLGYILMIGIFILVLGILYVAFKVFPANIDEAKEIVDLVFILLALAFGAISVVALFVWAWNIRRDRRYEAQGQLLLGKVTRAWGRWKSDSEGGRKFLVTVSYRVRLPEGTTLEHEATHKRGDLARGGLPNPGDPVAVLAIDRDHVRLL
jgi:hypothetical protein